MAVLLSPANSLGGCEAAFQAGAGGVYLGAKNWSRGISGHALPDSEISRCVALARSCGKVLHVALNIVPGHKESGRFVEKCRYYLSLGVDGLILNDFGLMANLLSEDRNAPVYASVGCGISNIADVAFYAELGVKGVVLPPGTPPREIKEIKGKYGLEVELFAEVLLEPLLFGKCWLGSYCSLKRRKSEGKVVFSGSARRGICSKGCRAGWVVLRNEEMIYSHYELAFEHFSLLNQLEAYLEAGADLLKIQGRGADLASILNLVDKYQKSCGRE